MRTLRFDAFEEQYGRPAGLAFNAVPSQRRRDYLLIEQRSEASISGVCHSLLNVLELNEGVF